MGAKTRTASYDKLVPDTRYNSLLLSKFINCLMWDGKKATAMRIFYDAHRPDQEAHARRRPDRRLHPGGRERQAVGRGPLQARRRGQLPGADAGQAEARQQSLAIRWILGRHPRQGRPADVTCAWPTSSWPPTAARARP